MCIRDRTDTDHKRERVLLILTAYGVLRVKTETEETDTVRQTQRGTDREGEETDSLRPQRDRGRQTFNI